MALNPSTNATMAGRVTAADANYPYGSSKDESAPGVGDGTPYFKARADDIFGLQQSLLDEASIVPSGNADNKGTSQYKEAIRTITNMKTITVDITVDANYTLTDIENRSRRVVITDTGVVLTGGVDIEVDDMQKRFIAVNETLQTLTFIIAGVGVDVLTGETKDLVNDGTDILEATGVTVVTGLLSTDDFIHVQDQKANTTAGGTSSAGVQTRTLNTILTNNISGASLSSNEITLPAGGYYVEASAPGYNGNQHKLTLRNVSDTSDILVGSNAHTQPLGVETHSFVSGLFTLAATKNVDLRHYITTVSTTSGLGVATSSGQVEVYSEIKIWKVG